jgi:myo-inositol-1(or 4)-monophosphatase
MEKGVKTGEAGQPLADDEALLAGAVQAAGELALSFFGRGLVGTRKVDDTPVSEADLAVDRFLHERLAMARPAYGWLSEESADRPERLEARRVWIVDPIDGTRAFLAGLPDWTISAALVEDGQPVLAAIFNPKMSEFFAARRGRGSALNGNPIAVPARDRLEGSRIFANKGLLRRKIWTEPWPRTRNVWANSITYRLALIAAGRADAALSITRKAEWDLAAAALLVQEAGGKVTDASGAAMRFNRPRPHINGLVAAAPALHELLIARTRLVAAVDEI